VYVATRVHSTTMWTEVFHFLTPYEDSYYTLRVDKKQTFLTPYPPPHHVHILIECPPIRFIDENVHMSTN
jgi:hypothetical protein